MKCPKCGEEICPKCGEEIFIPIGCEFNKNCQYYQYIAGQIGKENFVLCSRHGKIMEANWAKKAGEGKR